MASRDYYVAHDEVLSSSCPHCGAIASRRLSECTVCHRQVCDQCGSIQVSAGMRAAIHKECLKKSGHFKMIKFAP